MPVLAIPQAALPLRLEVETAAPSYARNRRSRTGRFFLVKPSSYSRTTYTDGRGDDGENTKAEARGTRFLVLLFCPLVLSVKLSAFPAKRFFEQKSQTRPCMNSQLERSFPLICSASNLVSTRARKGEKGSRGLLPLLVKSLTFHHAFIHHLGGPSPPTLAP